MEQCAGHSGGIIPAYAGSTKSAVGFELVHEDHPRVCGEHSWQIAWILAPVGSSPRMRGAPPATSLETSSPRIIPAYAGSTARSFLTVPPARDHPRVCGEHVNQTSLLNRIEGSSPRMRGAQRYDSTSFERKRIIPAYAGSTT